KKSNDQSVAYYSRFFNMPSNHVNMNKVVYLMKNRQLLTEVFWLRSFACLAVTLGHAIHSGYTLYVEPSIYHGGIYLINMSVFFGVPVFVFISEFILANKYLHQV